MLTLYSKDNCPHCVKAKRLLDLNGVDYAEKKIGHNITRDEVLTKFPDAKTVPIIEWNDVIINGASELETIIEQGLLH